MTTPFYAGAGSLAPPNSGFSDAEYSLARSAAHDYFEENGYWSGSFIEQRVAWGDCDMNHHVNNVVYLKWCESSRLAALSMFAIPGEQVRLILATMKDVKWIRAVMYPDVCMIAHRLRIQDKRTIIVEGAIYSYRQKRVVFVCEAKMVGFDYDKQVGADLPEAERVRMQGIIDGLEARRRAKL